MQICPKCHHIVKDGKEYCPRCGYPLYIHWPGYDPTTDPNADRARAAAEAAHVPLDAGDE